ncbi:MAG: hypothetical protein WDN49_15460 [Acetobacteraceae bacterium]
MAALSTASRAQTPAPQPNDLAPASGDPLPRAKPEDVGMSSARLARIDDALNADIQHGDMPGAVIAIARNNKLVYFRRSASATRPRERR